MHSTADVIHERRSPPRRDAMSVFASVALHLLIVLAALYAPLPARVPDPNAQRATIWLEPALGPKPEAVQAQPPEPPAPQTPTRTHVPARSRAPRAPQPIVPIEASNEATEGVPVIAPDASADTGEGALSEGTDTAGGTVPGTNGTGDAREAPESERQAGSAQLSVWMSPPELERLVLLRPMLTFLMGVPGYRDMLRGSSVKPLVDLNVLRVFLLGLQPERLAVAGVHAGGEAALLAAAQRVAAMRGREPEWRGSSELRATSWVDSSGLDRAFAVHGAAFVIGARASMPVLLGAASPAARVVQLSKLRRTVMLAWMIEDMTVYFPELAACGLQKLHVSIAAPNGGPRMLMTAEYAKPSLAQQAATCLNPPDSRLKSPWLIGWLTRAQVRAGAHLTWLRSSLSRDDIEHMLDEISAALRRAGRG